MARGKSVRAIAVPPRPGIVRDGDFVHGDSRREPIALAHYFAGPLPSPEMLHAYDLASEGAADRIIRMAEREAEHRHLIERQMLGIQSRNSTLGIASGFFLGLAGVLGGVYAVVQGADIAGAGVSLTALAALVGVFLAQRRPQPAPDAETTPS